MSSFESVEVLDAYVDGTLSAIEADFNITRVQVPSLGDEAWWTPVIEDATLLVRVGTRLISFSGDSGMQTVSNDQQKQFGILAPQVGDLAPDLTSRRSARRATPTASFARTDALLDHGRPPDLSRTAPALRMSRSGVRGGAPRHRTRDERRRLIRSTRRESPTP